MSAQRTKIFGLDLGIDPKILTLALVIVAIVIYYFTSSSTSPGTSSGSTSASAIVPSVVRPVNPSLARRAAGVRRANAARNDRGGTLKFVAVDGSRGDVDPTLRLGLLDRVRAVPLAAISRNLFDAGGPETATNLPLIPKNAPKLQPGPVVGTTVAAAAPPPPVFSIPLKYYGFVKPVGRASDGNRGFFMDGENILVGSEGDMLEKKFLIVALTPNSARLEDTQAKQGQDLQVTPAAAPAQ